jgi:baculoviral IAP repeat-containing protein 6
MILVADPYFNEPGHESMMRTPSGQSSSQQYNHSLRYQTLRFAVLQQLCSPPAAFADAIKAHFRLKRAEVEQQCEQWCNEAAAKYKKPIEQLVQQIKAELAKL